MNVLMNDLFIFQLPSEAVVVLITSISNESNGGVEEQRLRKEGGKISYIQQYCFIHHNHLFEHNQIHQK